MSPNPLPTDQRLHVGTLRYTMVGLLWVFVWLLWGDFCFTVMEYVNSQIVPLRLRELNAPDWVLPIILTTVPSIISFTLNPVISTISDRHRGPRGRRIPFLLFSAPFISATLVLMAFSPEIAAWLHRWVGPLGGWGLVGISIFTVGMLLASFKVFDTFVNTTFWYLFNDVVPHAFMARFMGMMRVVSSLAAMLFSYFFYEHALTHMREIYLGAATIYFVGFTLMCLFVKEGEYPPPLPLSTHAHSVWKRIMAAIQEYVRQCLSHRLYLYFFLMNMLGTIAGAIGVFGLFLNLSLGITLKQLGMINTGLQFVTLTLSYPTGALADRFHPLRVMLYMSGCSLLLAPLNFVWLFGSFPADRIFHVSLLGYAADLPVNLTVFISLLAIGFPIGMLQGAVGMPMMMRLLPREEFGQFCSFNAMVIAIMNILASLSVAWFMTRMRALLPDAVWGKDFCYRMIPAWSVPFSVLSLLFLCLLFREWKRHGGEINYSPPQPPVA